MAKLSSRDQILNRISSIAERRAADIVSVSDYQQEEIYKSPGSDLLACFKQELEAISGQCVICPGEEDVYKQLAAFVEKKGLPSLFSRDEVISENLRKAGISVEVKQDEFTAICRRYSLRVPDSPHRQYFGELHRKFRTTNARFSARSYCACQSISNCCIPGGCHQGNTAKIQRKSSLFHHFYNRPQPYC